MATPTAEDRAAAKALLAKRSEAEIRALYVNWRPNTPPLSEFVRHLLIVEKESGKLIPFDLWPAQEKALKVIEKTKKLVIPKGRQIGITTLELAAMLWAATFWGHRLFLIARQSDDYAQDAIIRLLNLAGYDANSDPPNLRLLPESTLPARWRPEIVGKNLRELRFANGSAFKALTASQRLARGLSAYWALADEFAFWPWPPEQLAAMESGCERLHVVSTGAGEGDAFQALWDNACAGRSHYKPLFLSSASDPRRDADWYRLNVTEAADPAAARREYARTPEEAFRGPEGVYFQRFERARHVQKIRICENWETFRAIDFGFRHAACLWAQRSPAGQIFIVDELLPENTTTKEFVKKIEGREEGYHLVTKPRASYCDPAGKSTNMQTAESEFLVLRRAGLHPLGRSSSVRDGCMRIMDALADPEQPLIVAERCVGLIRALAQVKPQRTQPEIYDTGHELFSHPLDALRYLYLNLPHPHGAGSISTGTGSHRRRESF